VALYPEFRGSVAFFDIETTGLSFATDQITTIALYDGNLIRTYVRGQNWLTSRGHFRLPAAGDLQRQVLDIPSCKANFPGLKLDQPTSTFAISSHRWVTGAG